jgi:hypothetical protein
MTPPPAMLTMYFGVWARPDGVEGDLMPEVTTSTIASIPPAAPEKPGPWTQVGLYTVTTHTLFDTWQLVSWTFQKESDIRRKRASNDH